MTNLLIQSANIKFIIILEMFDPRINKDFYYGAMQGLMFWQSKSIYAREEWLYISTNTNILLWL